MISTLRMRWIVLLLSTGAIVACGTPDIPAAQDLVPTVLPTSAVTAAPTFPPLHPTIDQPTTPTFTPDPAQPTIDPATPIFQPEPTDTPTFQPEPTLDPTDVKATAVADATYQAAYTFAHLPPTSAVPLVQSLRALGPHALLYTDGGLLQAYDLDSGTSIWLTAPASTHHCNTDSEGAGGESGTWSPDGHYIFVSCFVVGNPRVGILPLSIGKLYEVSAINADDEQNQGVEEDATWLPSGHQFVLTSRLREPDQLQFALVDAATRVLKPLAGMEDAGYVAGAPRGEAIAFLRVPDNAPTGELFLRTSDGNVKRLLPDSYVEMFTWTPDGHALDIIRKTQAEATEVETVRLDLASANVVPLAPYEQRLIWSPDGQQYLAQGVHPDGTTMPWEIHAADGTLKRTLPGEYAQVRWMPDNQQLITITTRSATEDEIVLIDASGNERSITHGASGLYFPEEVSSVSRDGTFFAVFTVQGVIQIFDLQGKEYAEFHPNNPVVGFGGWQP